MMLGTASGVNSVDTVRVPLFSEAADGTATPERREGLASGLRSDRAHHTTADSDLYAKETR
jgi:hypothetical protein